MRVLVCGGRDYKDFFTLYCKLEALHAISPIDLVIHGKCPTGADQLANIWASVSDIPVEAYPADWDKHGKAAGPIRNQQMLDEGKPNLVVAFPGGTGTEDMVRKAYRARVPVMEVCQSREKAHTDQ
jgi:hypothetical protein